MSELTIPRTKMRLALFVDTQKDTEFLWPGRFWLWPNGGLWKAGWHIVEQTGFPEHLPGTCLFPRRFFPTKSDLSKP